MPTGLEVLAVAVTLLDDRREELGVGLVWLGASLAESARVVDALFFLILLLLVAETEELLRGVIVQRGLLDDVRVMVAGQRSEFLGNFRLRGVSSVSALERLPSFRSV